jgi:two-component system sensor histidine kinase/response regulator
MATQASPSSWKVQLAFGSALLTLLIIAAISYRVMLVSSEGNRWVRHTQQVLEGIQSLRIATEKIDSATWGFVLTGDGSYIESYRSNVVAAEREEAIVRSLTVDNPGQQRLLPMVEALVAQKIHFADMMIRLRQTQGLEAAAAGLQSGASHRIVDEFEGITGQLRNEELRLLTLRDTDSKRHLRQSGAILVLGTVLGLLITAGAGWSVRQGKVARGLAEVERGASEERFRTLANNISQFAWMANETGWIFWYNERWFDYTGTTLEEMAGWGWQKVHHPDHRQRVVDKITACFRTGELWEDTFPLRGRDGNYRWFLSRAVPIRDPDGKILRWFGTNTDLTERREAEKYLVQMEARYRGLLEAAPDAMVVVNQGGDIVLLNVQAERQFGYSRDELLGQKVKNIIPEGFAERLIADALRSAPNPLAAQTGTEIDLFGRRKDGSEFPIEMMLSPLKSDEGILVTAAIRDISVRKAADAVLLLRVAELKIAKEHAEEVSRLKSEFLANMSHEIRTPMNGILGMTELTLDTMLSEEQRDYLTTVQASGESLLRIINDILDFSKSEAGQFTLDATEFSPDEVLQDAVHSLAVTAHQKGLELLYDNRVDMPELVLGDRDRLRQVVVNLLANAIKFTESGEVTLAAVAVCPNEHGTEMEFSITDTGIGISREWTERIFEPFVQADGSNTRRYGGTGLGLAISSRLANLMGGRIWVDSELGKGSIFHFTVNFGLATGSAEKAQTLTPEVLRGLAVLIVDDNVTNRRILQGMVTGWQMRPVLAESGPEALEILRSQACGVDGFALILLDAQMPDMDGFTLARRIQEDPLLDGARMMMISSVDRSIGPELRASGLAHYVVKPVTRASLLTAVLRALGEPNRHAKEAGRSAALPSAEHTLRILLAEDNPVNQRVGARLLEKSGHTVVIVSSGSEAVEAVMREAFDLILMDVQMPLMSGYEATRCIRTREQRTGGHIPIVAVTAHAMKGDREICLAAGMDDYLTKPLRPQELKAAIDRWKYAAAPQG